MKASEREDDCDKLWALHVTIHDVIKNLKFHWITYNPNISYGSYISTT